VDHVDHPICVSMNGLVGLESLLVEVASQRAQRRLSDQNHVRLEVAQRSDLFCSCRGEWFRRFVENAPNVLRGRDESYRAATEPEQDRTVVVSVPEPAHLPQGPIVDLQPIGKMHDLRSAHDRSASNDW